MTKLPTVVIADDHPIFLMGLRYMLEKSEQYHIVGEAENGKTAWQLIKELQPDVALLDIEMDDISGLEICEKIKSEMLLTKVIALTTHKDEDIFNRALEAGVQGYILKENSVQDLSEGIKTVLGGNYFFSSSVSQLLLSRNMRKQTAHRSDVDPRLTKTERSLMKLIAEGNTSVDIARKMKVSIKTINNHRANICKKLDLKGTNSLLVYAMKNKDQYI